MEAISSVVVLQSLIRLQGGPEFIEQTLKAKKIKFDFLTDFCRLNRTVSSESEFYAKVGSACDPSKVTYPSCKWYPGKVNMRASQSPPRRHKPSAPTAAFRLNE
ncbi:hypothetical protein TNCV_3628111 [Trichonephila clavipes]|nr:hypothetical protein TNCV_3628111 [Trichonephila clavipes]